MNIAICSVLSVVQIPLDLLKITKSPSLRAVKSVISLNPLDVFKSEMTALLGKLVNEVKAIDAQAQEFMLGQKPAQSAVETRTAVSEIRSRIIQKLSDYKEANPN